MATTITVRKILLLVSGVDIPGRNEKARRRGAGLACLLQGRVEPTLSIGGSHAAAEVLLRYAGSSPTGVHSTAGRSTSQGLRHSSHDQRRINRPITWQLRPAVRQ
jgi:hypothetical protein